MSWTVFQEYVHTRRYLESLGKLRRERQHRRYPGMDGQGGVGLRRMERLLGYLDHPERGLDVIHIGGTSGKGSVGRMVHESLHAAGVVVGSYTSPHVGTLLERIRVGARLVSVKRLCAVIDRLKAFVEQEYRCGPFGLPTFHELLFAVALQIFRESGVQIAVIEVGIGGRLDSTNIIPHPRVAAITNVGLDHTELLGDELAAIAWDKAHIIKPGCIAITGEERVEALAEIEDRARQVTVPLWRLGQELKLMGDSSVVQLRLPDGTITSARIGLWGEHQRLNASIAIGILNALSQPESSAEPLAIPPSFGEVFLPGRFELIEDAAMPGVTIVLDIAHNADKLKALAYAWVRRFGQLGTGVIALAANKDVRAVMPSLVGAFQKVIFTRPLDAHRAMHPPRFLMELARAVGMEASICLDPRDAVRRAHMEGRQPICVTGSTYLVGEIRNLLQPEAWVVGWRDARPVGTGGLARLLGRS